MTHRKNDIKIIVTGGAGFIGSHTVERLLELNFKVGVIDNLRTGSLENLPEESSNFSFINGDIRDIDLLKSVSDSKTLFVNLAALVSVPESINDPLTSHDINVNGTLNVFEVARINNCLGVVSASSAAVYGTNENVPLKELEPVNPMSPYGLHKSFNEQHGKLYSDLYSKPSVLLRFFNVYGPRQKSEGGYASVVPLFIKNCTSNQPATINGDGETVRDFIHVFDIVNSIVLSINKIIELNDKKISNYHKVFNVGTGKKTTLNELWLAICNVFENNIDPIYSDRRVGDIDISYSDIDLIKTELGFEPKISTLEGIQSIKDHLQIVRNK